MPAPLGLPRGRRVKQARDFARARTQGRRLRCGCLILNWCGGAAGEARRLGVVASRRVGGAVVRSRARRLLREVFRQNQLRLQPALDVILVATPSIANRDYAGVQTDFLTACRRAGLLT